MTEYTCHMHYHMAYIMFSMMHVTCPMTHLLASLVWAAPACWRRRPLFVLTTSCQSFVSATPTTVLITLHTSRLPSTPRNTTYSAVFTKFIRDCLVRSFYIWCIFVIGSLSSFRQIRSEHSVVRSSLSLFVLQERSQGPTYKTPTAPQSFVSATPTTVLITLHTSRLPSTPPILPTQQYLLTRLSWLCKRGRNLTSMPG